MPKKKSSSVPMGHGDLFQGGLKAPSKAMVKKFGGPPYVTRSTDKDGKVVDYIRHEPCEGKGCKFCDGFGFTKQYVLT